MWKYSYLSSIFVFTHYKYGLFHILSKICKPLFYETTLHKYTHNIFYWSRLFGPSKKATVIQRRHITMELYNAVITAEVHFTINKHYKINQKLPFLDDVSWFAETVQGNIGKIFQENWKGCAKSCFTKQGFYICITIAYRFVGNPYYEENMA